MSGRILGVESSGELSRVEIDVGGDLFTAVLLDTPQSAEYLREGGDVTMLFKETEVALAKNFSGLLSFRNQIPALVEQLEQGTILTRVFLTYRGLRITSLITTRAAVALDLKANDKVTALVKANEITLMRRSAGG